MAGPVELQGKAPAFTPGATTGLQAGPRLDLGQRGVDILSRAGLGAGVTGGLDLENLATIVGRSGGDAQLQDLAAKAGQSGMTRDQLQQEIIRLVAQTTNEGPGNIDGLADDPAATGNVVAASTGQTITLEQGARLADLAPAVNDAAGRLIAAAGEKITAAQVPQAEVDKVLSAQGGKVADTPENRGVIAQMIADGTTEQVSIAQSAQALGVDNDLAG